MEPGPFLDHDGGARPVPANTWVGIVFRGGTQIVIEPASNFIWEWVQDGDVRKAQFDIVKYCIWS